MPWAAIIAVDLTIDFGFFYIPPLGTILIALTGIATVGSTLLPLVRRFLEPAKLPHEAAARQLAEPRPAPRPAPQPLPASRSCRQFDVRNQPDAPPDERRTSLRRKGNPVDVFVTEREGEPFEAVVIDRSTGGLCLSLPRAIATDTLLKVVACHAPEETPLLAVKVRHCRQAADRWLCGCQFVESPPWSQLLLFG